MLNQSRHYVTLGVVFLWNFKLFTEKNGGIPGYCVCTPTNETKMGEYTGVSKQTGGWSAVEMLCL